MKLRNSKKIHPQKPFFKTSPECFICLFKRKEKLIHLNDCTNCKHTSNLVHRNCLKKWIKTCLKNKKKEFTCPLCNIKINLKKKKGSKY